MAGCGGAFGGFLGLKLFFETHRSTTDAGAGLYHKGPGTKDRLYFIGHGLMENCPRLIVDAKLTS